MMTNPGKYPKQHGNPGLSRAGQYARGMDVLIALTDTLAQFGPVVVGGDMNSHPGSGSWAAAPKMRSAGFQYAKDAGVMYLFYQPGVELVGHRQVRVASDHAAIVSTLDMNGKAPTQP
jgi:endonuclease/exonuclease/phosphatase (EEP) superfamily protein YafD